MNSSLSLKELVFTGLGRREQTWKFGKYYQRGRKKKSGDHLSGNSPQMIIFLTREYLNLNVDYMWGKMKTRQNQ